MAEELTTGPETTEGQTGEGLGVTQTTDPVPDGESGGQPEGSATKQKTGQGTVGGGEEAFFDPKDIEGKPELQAAYKQMQRAFTKKMEGIKGSKQKLDAYENFMADPIAQMQQIATRLGYRIVPTGQQGTLDSQAVNWEPQTWEEVFQEAEKRAYDRIKNDFSPLISEIRTLKKDSVERILDDISSDWRIYEDKMTENLREHPTLVKNPAALYAMSVPPEVIESRATQRALKKMQEKAESGKISGGSTTTKKPNDGMPDKPISFNEAVKLAEKRLQEEGIRRP